VSANPSTCASSQSLPAPAAQPYVDAATPTAIHVAARAPRSRASPWASATPIPPTAAARTVVDAGSPMAWNGT
jgi:hypothetical protein